LQIVLRSPTNDLESAIVATLPPGNYTAVLRGKNGTTGIGLVELYDLDAASDSKLANISTRGFVQTGSDVMIGGFILGDGTASENVIIRALGPSLTGIANVLGDPMLDLYDGNGTLLMSDDNWKDDASQACPDHRHWDPAAKGFGVGNCDDTASRRLPRDRRGQGWRCRRRPCGSVSPPVTKHRFSTFGM
jgi:hypothetical protein